MNLRRKIFLKTQTCLRTVFSIPYPWDKVTSPSDRCSDSRVDAEHSALAGRYRRTYGKMYGKKLITHRCESLFEETQGESADASSP